MTIIPRLKQHAKHLFPIFILVLIVACVGLTIQIPSFPESPFSGANQSSQDSNSQGSQDDKIFTSFANALFTSEVSGDGLTLHYTLEEPEDYGITQIPETLGLFSSDPAAIQASMENVTSAMESINYKRLSEENKLTYDILKSYFQNITALAPFTLYREPLAPYTGITSQLPVLLSEYALQNPQDVNRYLTLLQDFPNYFQSLTAFEQAKADAGLFMSKDSLEMILADCNAFIHMEDNYLISTFNDRINAIPNLSDEEQAQYEKKNEFLVTTTIIPSYEKLMKSLITLSNSLKSNKTVSNSVNESSGSSNNPQGNQEQTNPGLCNLPNGKEYYAALVESSTGSGRDITQIQTLISKQLVTDMKDFQKVVTSMDGENIARAASLSDTNPKVILETLEKKIPTTFPMPKDTSCLDVTVKSVPKSLEPYLSPAFYMIPAIDSTSDNTIYINEGSLTDSLELYTTLAHEGFPGHLYQTNYFASTNPASIRHLLDFGGYVEGWATYAEMCSYYLSDLTKEQATLLQKHASIMLGLYASTDIGIHYDNWSLEDTKKFWAAYGITSAEAIGNVYQLVVSCPANYLKYYVGYVEFLELKKVAIKNWGDKFSQKRFHKTVLEIGPAPFPLIKEKLGK